MFGVLQSISQQIAQQIGPLIGQLSQSMLSGPLKGATIMVANNACRSFYSSLSNESQQRLDAALGLVIKEFLSRGASLASHGVVPASLVRKVIERCDDRFAKTPEAEAYVLDELTRHLKEYVRSTGATS